MTTTATYVAATSLDEALAALAAGARPVAGGTDLVVGSRQGKRPLPESIVAIHRIEALRAFQATPEGLVLGALVSHATIAGDPVIRERYTALADASSIVGSRATRVTGTIGGNVMNASPAMETGGPLLCFGATVTLSSPDGAREVSLDELWTGPGRNSSLPGELLTAVTVPSVAAGTGSAYVRLEYRRQMEIAVVGATVVVTVEDGRVTDARVAITALSPTIRRVPEAEAALVGTDGDALAVAAAATATAEASTPIADVRGSIAYRRATAEVMARRAIVAALARARSGAGAITIPASAAHRDAV
jgi:CO/xanthine dehydrogenase FAD-binding subunit